MLLNIYRENQGVPLCHLERELEFLLSESKHFKRSDIKEMHTEFNVSDAAFNSYLKCLQNSLFKMHNNSFWLLETANRWRKYIVI